MSAATTPHRHPPNCSSPPWPAASRSTPVATSPGTTSPPTGSRHERYTLGGKPNRVTDISIHITPPAGLPAGRRDAFLAVASHCTVHNTLHEPPAVQITIDSGEIA